ncbi:bifunctional DNA-formamidopyrimidine glycosylase/DNA-(apurinic or apyrimidinic site) lyase [Sphingomonas donggukensis]|uniref:Formamidopyrimidine-DNA glycosylase n=1 Tax=Sphingomonas donggukensis TaxID=2949093 RepID=A0ABY4TR54_9SPHN|nr:bifunctional DNA-formamidopyrimidine glycosylase/DNA-(apurinic or apyrimidinic site) lyase [Sphingomonas donggukensis]URW74424.1 bifunctional DNA-formamidopyrimidine glycosylase/DNA-(apurinic or apyrimidinic site) lyase [Sphingomonas donggukensis]
MPELPEVETTVRGLEPVLLGHRIARVTPRRADLRRAMPADLGQRLTGATVTRLHRRAKYGLIDTDRGDTLVFHLGMSGRWRVDPADLLPHDHLLIDTDAGRHLALNDPRRFGSLDLMATAVLDDWAPFRALGPEPLGPELTGAYLEAAFEGRIAPVKALLLDQRVVAGLGNIYVCEALFEAGIRPSRPAGQIARKRLDRLVETIRAVLLSAIDAGGSTLRDYARPDGELGYFSKQFKVYGREGEPCACGGTVRRYTEGGRSTFWCPACQR